jgi:hypothetical protein
MTLVDYIKTLNRKLGFDVRVVEREEDITDPCIFYAIIEGGEFNDKKEFINFIEGRYYRLVGSTCGINGDVCKLEGSENNFIRTELKKQTKDLRQKIAIEAYFRINLEEVKKQGLIIKEFKEVDYGN